MTLPDTINAAFECMGGVFTLLNVRAILRDKMVRGIDLRVNTFFLTWGMWNLFYYPHLDQWLSFAAGVFLTSVSSIYYGLLIFYFMKEKRSA